MRSPKAKNEQNLRSKNGTRTGQVISTKVRKQSKSKSSSQKKNLVKSSAGKNSVNDIRKYFELSSPLHFKSDLAMEKSKLDGSRMKAENNTNRCLAKKHQQILTPTYDPGLSGGCQVPRDSNEEWTGLTPSEKEKQVQNTTLDGEDFKEI